MVALKLSQTSILVATLTAALAGCISAEDAGQPAATDPASTGGNGNQTETSSGAPAVQAAFSILVDGNVSQPVDGTHALAMGVNVTLDASSSVGQNLSFAWDLGDGNSTFGVTATVSYGAPGNFTIVLAATDDHGGSDSATANVTVSQGAGSGVSPGTVVHEESMAFTTTLTNPLFEVDCGETVGEGTGMKTFLWTLVGQQADGTISRVNRVEFAMTSGPTAIDLDMYFYDPAGKEVGSSHGFEPLDGPEAFTVEKVLEPGEYKLVVQACAALNASVTVDATAIHVAV